MGQLGTTPLIKAAKSCELPKCASCKYAKAKHQTTMTSKQAAIPLKQMALNKDQLNPGQQVSMDHFKVTNCGKLYTSRGKTHLDMIYSGGCILEDHAMGFVHIEHMINFTTMETIQAK